MTEKFVSVEENKIWYLDFGDSDKTLILILAAWCTLHLQNIPSKSQSFFISD